MFVRLKNLEDDMEGWISYKKAKQSKEKVDIIKSTTKVPTRTTTNAIVSRKIASKASILKIRYYYIVKSLRGLQITSATDLSMTDSHFTPLGLWS